MRALAVLTVRNEGAFLLEWLAHHKGIGFTDFLVLSNDCDDGTDAMLDRLQEMGEITHLPNPAPHDGGVQWAGLKRADRHPLVARADWIMALDIDEFVNIHHGDRTLSALLRALPEASAITLTWRMFGNCGVERFEDRPVSEQFTCCAPHVMLWPWRVFMFKTLYRNDGTYRKLGVHRPRSPDPDKVDAARWFDCEGRELEDRFKRRQIFSPFGRPNYALAQLNHYACGSMESFLVKRDRGRAVHGADALGLDYWTERNWCDVEDGSIRASDPLRDPHLVRLKSDPGLARLHDAAVAWRRDRFAELLRDDDARALYGRLLLAPPARVVPPDRARFLFGYAQKTLTDQD